MFVNIRVTEPRHFLLVQVHERNTLTMSDSVALGSTMKVESVQLTEGNVFSLNYEVRERKLVRYPRKSRSPCQKGKNLAFCCETFKMLCSFISRDQR